MTNQAMISKLIFLSLFMASFQNSFAQTQDTDRPDTYNPFFVTSSNPSNPSNARPPRTNEVGCNGGALNSSGTLGWSTNESDEIPGIYWATLLIRCRNDRTIVIWTDINGGFGSGFRQTADTESGKDGEWSVTGKISETNSFEYTYSVDPSGEQYALFNDQYYDLSNGDVFLISTQQDQIRVKQININMTRITSDDIMHLAIFDSEISGFFEESVINQ